jgi:hypothetical protein
MPGRRENVLLKLIHIRILIASINIYDVSAEIGICQISAGRQP